MEAQKQQVTTSVRDTTEELTQLTKTVRAATAEQATASSSMAAAAEQLTVSIDQVAEHADRALNVTRETVVAVKDGEKAVEEAITVMEETAQMVFRATERVDELGKQSVRIQEIVSIIQGIAKQTDLLALNASIESARAGEAGRGFAVVAEEVRSLAEKTNTSAHDISSILTQIREQMEQVSADVGVASSKATESAARSRGVGAALERIDNRSRSAAGAMEDIASAAREQSVAGHDIAQQVEMVAGSSEKVSTQINKIDELMCAMNRTMTSM
jgi:methyl-accepting chemotaxis protein